MRWVKASGRTEPLKERPEWVQKLVSFRKTRVKGK
ncbi:rCG38057 [Rattus norvegicus]|uniref:RCG38057 n=1 Tax=Rattus norvegicus TaxID=10116 RepID=A6IVH9_RAT|nr:rCG38057 [Rattus norvegicus]